MQHLTKQIIIEDMLRYFFSLIVLIISCSPELEVNNEFMPYFKQFEREANNRGIKLKYKSVEIRFQKDLTETKHCYAFSRSTTNDKLIVVDTDFWENEIEPKKELVLYHEFGHAFLCRKHEITLSVMRSNLVIEDWQSLRVEMIDELFKNRTCD